VGVYIDKVLTDPRLPWSSVHLGGDAIPGVGRLSRFLSGVRIMAARREPIVFVHTLKGGLAGALARPLLARTRLIYVGHGVRYHQKHTRALERLKYQLAEIAVYLAADAVVHLRQGDIDAAAAIVPAFLMRRVRLLQPRLGEP
jgi:hypothetical protein